MNDLVPVDDVTRINDLVPVDDVTRINDLTRLNDLPPLNDIINDITFEDESSIFDENYAMELVESALYLMEDFMTENPTVISDPDFHTILLEELKDLFFLQFEEHIFASDYVEDDLNDILEYAFQIYISMFHIERSEKTNTSLPVVTPCMTQEISDIIQRLKCVPQPVQRTPEWYAFRWNLITASNAWKAFESQSTINQLIYEKCQPLEGAIEEDVAVAVKVINKMVNVNTTLHWGQKYEPLSVMFYEKMYDSKVDDFGCIQHQTYKFIGASPDGIVMQSNTGRYGRMLEIKNIVNREINGIPKKEYWIQMQLQMEVCDLNECDFLETKFVEYPDYDSYKNDDECNKGVIVYLHKNNGSPHYEYMPLHLATKDEIMAWEDGVVSKYESSPYNYTFVKFIYWKLAKLSCVLVVRNKEWFKNNVGQLEKVWDIIKQERITGCEHRAPSRKTKKEYVSSYTSPTNDVCFLKVVKLDTVV